MHLAIGDHKKNQGFQTLAIKTGHTPVKLELPHTYNVSNLSGVNESAYATINFAIRNVDYEVFVYFAGRFDRIKHSKLNTNDITVFIEMRNTKYNNEVFKLEIGYKIDEIINHDNQNEALSEKFNEKYFSIENNIHRYSKLILDNFDQTGYIYNITLNTFISLSYYYINYMKEKIEENLPLPPIARVQYRDRFPIIGSKKENALEFAERVWGDYISANRLYQKDIRSLDRPLYDALKQMSDSGKIALHQYIRTVESRTAMRVTSCINELAAISNTDPELNETIFRQVDLLRKELMSRLSDSSR